MRQFRLISTNGDPLNKELVAVVFGANLGRIKRERGLSLTEIAERAGIHQTHLGLLLRGRRIPRIDTVLKVAAALEVTPDALLVGVTWNPQKAALGAGRFEKERTNVEKEC
jgi:transcriptional regulator with XRE-family HTH domain